MVTRRDAVSDNSETKRPPLTRGTPGKPAPNRAKLAQAISALNEEQTRLNALQSALDRAHYQGLDASRAVTQAEQALREARALAPQRMAYAFANNQDTRDDREVAEAQGKLDKAQAEVEQLHQVEKALEVEVAQSQTRLNRCTMLLHNALGAVIVASPEYPALYAELRATWARLRTIRAVIEEVESLGHVTPPHSGRWIAREPIDRHESGYAIDRELIAQWRAALERLQNDAEAELPTVTR